MLVSAVLVLGSLCVLLAVGCFPPLPGLLTVECVLLYVRFQVFFLVVFGCVVCVLSCWSWNLIAMCSVLCGLGLC